MKTHLLTLILTIMATLGFGFSSPSTQDLSYDQLWKQVKEAESKDHPKTVVEICDKILDKARKENNKGQMLKAYFYRVEKKIQITPDTLYSNIKELEKMAAEEKDPATKMVLHSCLGTIYSNYAGANAWSLAQRTNIDGGEDVSDIEQWGSMKITQTILENVNASLSDINVLRKTDNKAFVPFVEQHTEGKYFNHDLLHIIVKRAVGSLEVAEEVAKDKKAVKQRRQQIWNDAIQSYRDNSEMEAYILMSMDYIEFQDLNDDKRIKALEDLMDEKVKANPLCTEILIELAQAYSSDNPAKAMELCDEGKAAYPSYKRTKYLKELKENLLKPKASLTLPSYAYTGDKREVYLTHRNLDKVTVIFYKVPESIQKIIKEKGIHKLEDSDLRKCQQYSVQSFAVARPADYKDTSEKITIEIPSEPGIYTSKMIAQGKEIFNWNLMAVGKIKLMYSSWEPRKLEVIAVDRISGHPLEGVKIIIQSEPRKYGDKKKETVLKTGKDGKTVFEEDTDNYNGYVNIKAELGEDKYMPLAGTRIAINAQDLNHYGSGKLNIITDRSIYRPGQTVYVKGLYYYQKGDEANVREGEKVTVELLNHNREVVDKKEVVTNSFGSFDTSLQIPSGGLMGSYTIKANSNSVTIRVEEYKRPTFEVRSDKIEGTYKFGDRVEVKANAKTFSGVPVDDADVKYTVTRRKWRYWSPSSNDILETGELKTDGEGNVKIPVTLLSEEDDDVIKDRYYSSHYSYEVKIDVTNAAGETQGTTAFVYAGTKSMILNCSGLGSICKDRDDIKLEMIATNLAQSPVETTVKYTLYRLVGKDGKEKVEEGTVKSNTPVKKENWKTLPSGKYRIEYYAKDNAGELVEGARDLTLFSLKDSRPIEGTDFWTYKDGDYVYYGTSFKDAVVFIDVYANNKLIDSKLVKISDQILSQRFVYIPEYGDGATIYLRMVHDDRMHNYSFSVFKPHPDYALRLKWSVFRDRLIPGQKEEWKMSVVDAEGKPADAEVLAMMYDASLDKICPYSLSGVYHNFPRKLTHVTWYTQSSGVYSMSYTPSTGVYVPGMDFDDFSKLPQFFRRYYYSRNAALGGRVLAKSAGRVEETMMVEDAAAPMAKQDMRIRGVNSVASSVEEETAQEATVDEGSPNQAKAEAEGPQVRTNFNETAFFLPNLVTDKDGNISISFTLPESLTKWRFISMAHTKDLKTGYKYDQIEAKKDFMISPNMPRFLRNGDKTTIASTLTNLSDKDIEATVKFEMFDPATEKVFHTQTKKVSAKASKTGKVAFSFPVEDTYDVVGIRIVAEGGQFSDGEQHLLAVLSDKIRLVESVALPIRGEQKKEFSLESLFNHHSASATKKTLTIEFTGNPAWYAVQALPSLAEPDDDCAICWTNALYANVLASKIANSQPKIKNVYESWKKSGQSKETLLSNLQKNQELKTILLSESPWVLEAKSEEDQKNMISALFDVMSIGNTKDKALKKLQELQMPDGGWTWFKGMESSPWITEYVLTQDIRLRILTVDEMSSAQKTMHQKGMDYMHNEVKKEYDWIMKKKIKTKGVSYFILKYLYLVALEAQANGADNPVNIVPKNRQKYYNYFLNKVAEAPRSQDMQEKSMAAVVLKANGNMAKANEYMQSIREHLTSSEEMGMYFAFNENPYRWGSMNVNAQVAAIEAFDQVAGDMKTVEEMKIWLLKQKQTQMWGTSVLTADAIFALLARGDNWLASEGVADLSFAGRTVSTNKPDEEGNAPIPGLNYIKRAYTDKETTDAKTITVEKKDKGIAWGAAYATFFEKLENVKNNGGKEMSITKELFVKRVNKVSETGNTDNGALAYTLEPIKNGAVIKVGDIVTARMVIKIDRRMDFVQLKEQRGACFEPMTQISGYRYGGGTGYYEEIKDAATSFFFYSLGKGTYVLEVNYRASRPGEYEVGLATLQCAYAPEYTAHTTSTRITVEEK
ncbi:MAG: alpha-2-macroglobulin [Bacteroidales bacterium]|nr:alpha-2-macroglobulin [Bacteroidales bacterium]